MNHIAVKEKEYAPEHYEVAWSFIEREYAALESLCKKYSRGQVELVDELMADVVTLRMPGIIATYKLGGQASLRTHVMANVKWYLFKQMHARDKHLVRYGAAIVDVETGAEHYGTESTIVDAAIASDEVQYILSLLSPYDRSLISLYDLCHVGFEELSDILGVSYGTARKHYRQALARAREASNQEAWKRVIRRCSILDVLCVNETAP